MATFRVNTQTQLDAAVRSVKGGDTILLGSGTYGRLELNSKTGNFTQKVVIESTDAGRPAVINQLTLNGARNVELRDVKFDYDPSKTGSMPFTVQSSRGITFDDVTFEGHVAGSAPQGTGLRILSSQDVVIRDSTIEKFNAGMVLGYNQGMTLERNVFSNISEDGMRIVAANNLRISNNQFRDFDSPTPGSAHKDVMHFYTKIQDVPSKNVFIQGNYIESSDVRHAMLFGNEKARAGDRSAWYENITVENNYLKTAHTHGITIEHGNKVSIRGNTLVQNPDEGFVNKYVHVPLINVSNSSVGVTITGNRAPSVPDAQPTWTVANNVTTLQSASHWEGGGATLRVSSGSQVSAASSFATTAGPAVEESKAGGSAETVKIDGNQVSGVRTFTLEDLDFAFGDELILRRFNEGTFAQKGGGNAVSIWLEGGSARIDSIVDLREIVAFSRDVSASTSGDVLDLRVAQDDGVALIRLDGLGDEFRAVDPGLF